MCFRSWLFSASGVVYLTVYFFHFVQLHLYADLLVPRGKGACLQCDYVPSA